MVSFKGGTPARIVVLTEKKVFSKVAQNRFSDSKKVFIQVESQFWANFRFRFFWKSWHVGSFLKKYYTVLKFQRPNYWRKNIFQEQNFVSSKFDFASILRSFFFEKKYISFRKWLRSLRLLRRNQCTPPRPCGSF